MEIYDKLTETEKARLLFIHAVTGCDTVSGIFGQGKPKLLKKLGNAASLSGMFDELLTVNNVREVILEY